MNHYKLEVVHRDDADIFVTEKLLENDGPVILLVANALSQLENGRECDCLLCGKNIPVTRDAAALVLLYPLKRTEVVAANVSFLCAKCVKKDNLVMQCGNFIRDHLFKGEETVLTFPHEIGGHA